MSIPVEVWIDDAISNRESSITSKSVFECKLIDRTDDSIVVVRDSLDAHKAIEIRKDRIVAMNYLDVPLRHPFGMNLLSGLRAIRPKSVPDTVLSKTKN